LRLGLDQLWVVSSGKEASGEEEEAEAGSEEDSTCLLFIWPTGSCMANFGLTPSKDLQRCRRATEGDFAAQQVGQPKGGRQLEEQGHPLGSGRWTWLCGDSQPLLLPVAWRRAGRGLGEGSSSSRRRRRRGLPWPFAVRRSRAVAQAPGQAGSGCSRALFGQPLTALCGEDGTLPQPIQELLAVLQREGPSTEGIFHQAASGTALRELREALDHGADVDMGSQPALLLAGNFLRSIPSKLLVNDLYEDWMAAMQKASKEEKAEALKAVAEKLPAANLLLLKRLLCLLQHIGHNAASNRMSCSNLAICVGPNLLSPPNEEL
ncbi:PREDICTED: T-cell activation Rho GTPase-activating protein-like, partial [Phaethon lepturus]|uniref:T-cell activation Rho GTPase-activating protein-like n=1 Tax=Phaethon lepturus TaxID=97097 RepID=UPI0005307655